MEEECVMSYENINIKKFLEEKAEKTGKIFSIDSTQTGAHRLHGKLLKSSGISKKGGSDKTLTPLEIQR